MKTHSSIEAQNKARGSMAEGGIQAIEKKRIEREFR